MKNINKHKNVKIKKKNLKFFLIKINNILVQKEKQQQKNKKSIKKN